MKVNRILMKGHIQIKDTFIIYRYTTYNLTLA